MFDQVHLKLLFRTLTYCAGIFGRLLTLFTSKFLSTDWTLREQESWNDWLDSSVFVQ